MSNHFAGGNAVLNLPLIVKRKAWWLQLCKAGLVFCLIGMAISHFGYSGKHILPICGITFVLAIVVWKVRGYDVTGQLRLSGDTVSIAQAAGTEVYPIAISGPLFVVLTEVKGEFTGPRTFTTKQGMDNHLYLTSAGKRKDLMFLLEPKDVAPLQALVAQWRSRYADMKLSNFTQKRF